MDRNPRLLFVLLALFWFSTVIAAQEHYSPDSLMAAFGKDSKSSPKGSPITLSGVVVESRKTRVVFKSSSNDKVICELVAPVVDSSTGPAVGAVSTVLGRVRGRGSLGNVTLDDCSIMTIPKVTETAPLALPEIPPVLQDIPQLPSVVQPVQSKQPEVRETRTAVVEKALPTKPALTHAEKPTTAVASAIPVEYPVASKPESPVPVEQPLKSAAGVPRSSATCVCNLSYAFIGFLVGLAFLSCVKLVPVITRPNTNNDDARRTPEMRRVALERLLLKQKKR
jgi:hypothetical protein